LGGKEILGTSCGFTRLRFQVSGFVTVAKLHCHMHKCFKHCGAYIIYGSGISL